MILFKDGVFHLGGRGFSYVFRVTEYGHLENLHFGTPVTEADLGALTERKYLEQGGSVLYDSSNRTYCLDDVALEYGITGRGDFRHPSLEIKMPDSTYVCDFVYQSHSVACGGFEIPNMPSPRGEETLIITLKDRLFDVVLSLVYTTYGDVGAITRSCYITNNCDKPISIRRLMSMQLDLPHDDFTLHTFDGAWIKERYKCDIKTGRGLYVNESITGNSSARHNPFIMLSRGALEQSGECYGFNLVYSGNHYEAVDISPAGKTRVMSGINPHCFECELASGESFYTPAALLAYSGEGFNGLSQNLHEFVKKKIIPRQFESLSRPIAFNNWEGTYFDFNTAKIRRLVRRAASLGAELFVLDDGWFSNRFDDHRALGDWTENRTKLKGGIAALSRYVYKHGMQFGLWFEPEMVSKDSNLFRAHPEYALAVRGRTPCEGRNQYVLDLCNKAVRDYIVDSVCAVLESAKIDYVKWDMNRNISDAYSACAPSGMVFHSYILGLYDVLERITARFPSLLIHSCASGGNRFDLGMLCYAPEVWTSDNTDGYSRLSIQGGTSYGYPPCVMGAHVASSPSHQALRRVPLETRFNVAAFGVLGYELDLDMLTRVERRAVRAQTEFYKKYRSTLQFGDFYRLSHGSKTVFISMERDKSRAIVGVFEGAVNPAEPNGFLPCAYLDEGRRYSVAVRKQMISLNALGGLINFVSPVKIRGDGILQAIISSVYALEGDEFALDSVSGALLNRGAVKLNQRFQGTGHHKDLRLLADFDSRLYVLEAVSS